MDKYTMIVVDRTLNFKISVLPNVVYSCNAIPNKIVEVFLF